MLVSIEADIHCKRIEVNRSVKNQCGATVSEDGVCCDRLHIPISTHVPSSSGRGCSVIFCSSDEQYTTDQQPIYRVNGSNRSSHAPPLSPLPLTNLFNCDVLGNGDFLTVKRYAF